MFLLIGISFLVTSLVVLSILVLLRGYGTSINRIFAYFSLILACWILFNFIGANFKQYDWSEYFILADFLTGPLVAFYFTLFSIEISKPVLKVANNIRLKYLSVFFLIASIATILLPETVNVVKGSNGLEVVYGKYFDVYSLLLVALFSIGLIVFVLAWKVSKGKAHKQLSSVLTGLLIAVICVASANLLVPTLTDSKVINLAVGNLAYVSIVIYVVFVAFTIVKHRLFDLKLIVARSFAYVLTLATVGVLYGITAFVVVDGTLFGGENEVSFVRRFVYTILAILFGLSFAPAKRLFDKLSDKIFYHDSYNSQELIDELTSILVSNVDLAKLLEQASKLIEAHIKPTNVEFLISDNGSVEYFSSNKMKSEKVETFQSAERVSVSINQKVIDLEIVNDKGVKRDVDYLTRNDVSLLVKLNNRDVDYGYMLVGIKRSGNIYNRNDKSVFEIIADEFSLAIENSLSYRKIQQFNQTLQAEVDDATKRLRYNNAKLKSLDETKDEFISMASHQLRTPLTSVKGYLSMVIEGDVGKLNEQQKKLLTQAFISSQRMNYLISDLLNVSRLKTGKFLVEQTPTYLPDVIDGEMDQLRETAAARGLDLKFEKPKDFPTLNLDETKIRQVIMNFIDNAIYYTQAGGNINIQLENTDKTVEFKVIDNGLGVPRHEQHQLFNKFFRADNARRARPDGTGLGLFMAKKVVIAQGGAIIFKSVEGKGSTFGFSFPLAKLEIK